jgi:hypothetical protein
METSPPLRRSTCATLERMSAFSGENGSFCRRGIWLVGGRAILLFISLTTGFSQITSTKLPKIFSLRPNAFTELPSSIVRELIRRSCRVPQPSFYDHRQNVIKGEFARSGQEDWAVVCWTGREAKVLVFWNSSVESPGELFTYRHSRHQWGPYMWSIGAVGNHIRNVITDEIHSFPTHTHQGIVLLTDTTRRIVYYDEGRWQTLEDVSYLVY